MENMGSHKLSKSKSIDSADIEMGSSSFNSSTTSTTTISTIVGHDTYTNGNANAKYKHAMKSTQPPRSTLSEELTKKLSSETSHPKSSQQHHRKPTLKHIRRAQSSKTMTNASNIGTNGSGGAIMKDVNYTLFRTKSSGLERQLSRMQSRKIPVQQYQHEDGHKHQQNQHQHQHQCYQQDEECEEVLPSHMGATMTARRYFDALKGPELEILKDSEEILLPTDVQWPFLLRFPISSFGVSLGLGSQTILWKALARSPSMHFLGIPLTINLILWCMAILALLAIFTTYSLKCLFYFEAVRREYYHPIRVNFFFAPWIACMFLTLGVPPSISTKIHPVLWCIFMAPIFLLELKIYGQWLSGGLRRLSRVANPCTHLSLVGNFVGALLAATVSWKEASIFFWAVGVSHYLVLFVTLYQRLPTAEVLPKELHPIFFLFVAAPSIASVAWEHIIGGFDIVSRTIYFVGLFLYLSLVVRCNMFRGFKFSISWWAYTFPMTASAVATIRYSLEVRHLITQGMAVSLSFISTITVSILFIFTVLHGFRGTLFPNDLAIAIMPNRPNQQAHKRSIRIRKDKKNENPSRNTTRKHEDIQ